MSWRAKVIEGLVLLLAAGVVARVVFGLLGPLLGPLLALTLLTSLLFWLMRGPHADR